MVTTVAAAAYFIQVCGDSADGTWTCTPVTANPDGADSVVPFPGYYFTGSLDVYGWKNYSAGATPDFGSPGDCDVPAGGTSAEWTTCTLGSGGLG